MKNLLLGFCYIITTQLFAQKMLKGKVLSSADNKPIISASVYLSNTAIGTASREDGCFSINNFPEGQYDLIVSSLGYETRVIMVNFSQLSDSLTITLTPKTKEMANVTVEPFIKNGWKVWGNFFTTHFIGQSPNAKHCKLLNKEAVRFRLKKIGKYRRMLEAVATEPLIIENQALGYTLTYDLELFQFNTGDEYCSFQGHPLFTEMKTLDEATQQKWLRNRQEAYGGSLMHFLRSLYCNQLKEEGFSVTRIQKSRAGNDLGSEVYLMGDSIAYSLDSNTVQLQFINCIEVVYAAKKATKAYVDAYTYITKAPGFYVVSDRYGKIPQSRVQRIFMPQSVVVGQPLTARLMFNDSGEGVTVLHNGYYYPSINAIPLLYWEWSEKICNLLPVDYGNPAPVNAEQIYKPQ